MSAQVANALAARLRALRQQAGLTPASEAREPLYPSPSGRRWREAPDEGPASDSAETTQSPRGQSTNPSVASQLRSLLNLRERRLRELPTQRQPLAPPIGREISAGLQLVESTIAASGASPTIRLPNTDEQVPRARFVCFDTETTGLAGGVGTKAFMIGAAQWRDGHLHIRQLYLTTLAGEAAMLRTFASWLAEDSIFVSYNGKSYDAPLLKGRYRIHRQQHPFESRRHVDLLHPVRRAYRGVWGDCRLQTIERNLLGIVREDDLPGSAAPAAWLAFLRGVGSRNLARVVEHNRRDVWTLAGLMERLAQN